MNLSFFSFHLMTVFFWRWITSHYGDDDSMKKYFDWGKTDLWGFMRFLDTMKIHGIIENYCEDFIRIWWTNIELARHRVIWWLSICPSITNAPTRHCRRLAVKKWLLYMACFWFTNHKKMFLTAEKHVHFGIIVEPAVMKGAYMSVSKNSIDSPI